MRYQGSKYKIRNILQNIIEPNILNNYTYIEPFSGGCNSIAYINAKTKIASDSNKYIIAMWKGLQQGTFNPPQTITKEEYCNIKKDWKTSQGQYPDALIGYVATCCSYGGGWFAGYANYNPKKKEDHIKEAYNGLMKHIKHFNNFQNTTFINQEYDKIVYPENSIIYCDPPYASTKKYITDFNSEKFYQWMRDMSTKGYIILMSEYTAPPDFICIWSKTMQDGMASVNKQKIEKIYVHSSIIHKVIIPEYIRKAI